MHTFSLPFPYKVDKQELWSFYLSFLIRWFMIKWEEKYTAKINKKYFFDIMKQEWFTRSNLIKIWERAKEWVFFNYICDDYVILKGKENVISDKWFITRIESSEIQVWYYRFCQFITEIYALRPVKQTESFKNTYKFKKKNTQYNAIIEKRSLWEKQWRGQRKISVQSWCCLKTVNNRMKKSKKVHTLKRFDSYNWFRIRKPNLYFTLENRVFIYYNKNNTANTRKILVKAPISSLINKKAIFLNNSISLLNSNDTIYNICNTL